jgi:hypothetical protein
LALQIRDFLLRLGDLLVLPGDLAFFVGHALVALI